MGVVVCPSGAPSIVSIPNYKVRKDRLMKRRTLVALFAVSVTVVAALLISSQTVLVSAQNGAASAHKKGDREEPPPPFYNPYPFGILPPDLDSEIARVLREVDNIEFEALAQLRSRPPPILTGQPPTLPNTGQRPNVLSAK